jgi:nucleoside-diphosphate-sugar epimerase
VRHGGEAIEGAIELARTRDVGNLLRVECERATLEFHVNERHRVRVIPKPGELVDVASGVSRGYAFDASWNAEPTEESWYATFGRQFEDWLAAIRGGHEPLLSGRSALPTARLIEACYSKPLPIHEPWVTADIQRNCQRRATTASDNGHPAASRTLPPRIKRVLLTGATGFIGGRVAEVLRLHEHCDVRAVVHNPGNASRLARLDVELVQADLGLGEDVKRLVDGCDAVIHCAMGTAWGEPQTIRDVTVGGTRRLAEAARQAGVERFVHLSTMSVYGDDSELTGVLEESAAVRPPRGAIYGQSKAEADQVVFQLAEHGLPAVILRPARVFGPFARIYTLRPIQAIRDGRFRWLGSPDVPCDMVYVDNVVEAILCALRADHKSVVGEAFNVSEGDAATWREFYGYFASRLGLDMSAVQQLPLPSAAQSNGFHKLISLPRRYFTGIKQIVSSPEFKSLGRRMLQTDPVGTLPRKSLEMFPSLERGVRRIVKADESLPVYRPAAMSPRDVVELGSGGAMLSIEKARSALGYKPRIPRPEALQLTLEWIRHARLV